MHRSYLQETDEVGTIARAARGDREAYGQLYERYVKKIYLHIYYLTGSSIVAEDLTAQTFLKALEAIHRYEPRGVPFLAWLIRIAHNLTLNHRKRQRYGFTSLPDEIETPEKTASPEELCEAKFDGEHIWHIVRGLRQDQRQVILMRFIDGLSYPDIAEILGKSIGAVRVIQHRALATLRRALEADAMAGRPVPVLNWSPA